MKLRHMVYLLLLMLSYTGSVVGEAWMIWDHMAEFHGMAHSCRHDCDRCTTRHAASMRCDCPGNAHHDADRALYIVASNDLNHRQYHLPVAALPPFLLCHLSDPLPQQLRLTGSTRQKIPLAATPQLRHIGLRAPPVVA